MTRRRRAVAHRTVAQRLRMWDRKLEPDTYAVYLTQVKDMARDKFLRYQAVHEYLIKIVKDVVSKHPDETARQHAYMWFAQGLWYCTQRYSDTALQREADSLYIYYLCLGLKDEALREVASRLGVKISPISYIVEKVIGLKVGVLTSEQVYEGTKQALEEVVEPYLRKPDIVMDKVKIDISYDANKNISQMTITDKVTGESTTITFTYDAEGYLVSIDET